MEGASAVASRQPPPRWRRSPRKVPPLATASLSLPKVTPSAATGRVLPVSVRAEPLEGGNSLGSAEGPSETEVPLPLPSSPPEKPAAKGAGAGFGGISSPKNKRGKQKGSVIRRDPILKPSSLYSRRGDSGGSPTVDQGQQTVNESAFLLTWLGLGLLILIEGIALAASGFLPEGLDNLFTKYVYPAFTPTVILFVGGTVAYGAVKYLQGEKQKS